MKPPPMPSTTSNVKVFLSEIIAIDDIMEDVINVINKKENTCDIQQHHHHHRNTKPRRASPLGKRSLDDAWEDSQIDENMGENIQPEHTAPTTHDESRKSPKLEDRRDCGINANGRIRALEEEEDRLRKRKEKERERKILAVRKMGVRKGLKRL